MNKPVLSFAILIISLFSFSCNNGGTPAQDTGKESRPVFDLVAARKEIDSANRNFMDLIRKGDSVGLANAYTVDAQMMAPNAPAAAGRKNIQTMISYLLNMGVGSLGFTTTGLWGDENMLIEEGIDSAMSKDGKVIDKGKYIVLWKKEEGKWKLFRDCFNSDWPAPASK